MLAFAVDRLREIWPAVTKVGRWSDKAMQLDVGGVACIVTSESKSVLWNVEQLAPSAKLGLHVFLQVWFCKPLVAFFFLVCACPFMV